MSTITDFPLLVFVFTFVVLWVSAWTGTQLRRKRQALEDAEHEDFGVIQGAALTLLALIIGFSFSMAVGRYDLRKNYEEAEANAIGTEYVRAGLLPAAEAAQVRLLLKSYLDQRVLFYTTHNGGRAGAGQRVHGPAAERTLVGRTNGRNRATNTHLRVGCLRHERRTQLAGLHPGSVVEPYSRRCVVSDGGNRHRLAREQVRGSTRKGGMALLVKLPPSFGIDMSLENSAKIPTVEVPVAVGSQSAAHPGQPDHGPLDIGMAMLLQLPVCAMLPPE